MTKNILSILSLTFLSLNAKALDLTFEESIEINRPIEEVFDFAADARNDASWRTEVHSIFTNGPFVEGTQYIEDAFLGLHYHYNTKVELEELEAPFKAIYRTTRDNPFMLESHRQFERMDENNTIFTYTVHVEKALIHDILFRGFPTSVAEKAYRQLMRSYLRKLRRRLELKLN